MRGGHTKDNMALSNQQKTRVAGGCLSAFRAQSNSAVLCCGLIARGNGLLTQEAFGVLAHEYCKNSTYILASLFVAAVFMSPFSSLFRFCFCYLILLK